MLDYDCVLTWMLMYSPWQAAAAMSAKKICLSLFPWYVPLLLSCLNDYALRPRVYTLSQKVVDGKCCEGKGLTLISANET